MSQDDHDHQAGEHDHRGGAHHDHHDPNAAKDAHREARRQARRERGSVGGWITNWNESDESTAVKLGQAARNLFVSRWKNQLLCCGHPGQPGC